MPETWVCSDHHFDHPKIIEYTDRPFRDVQEMNEALVRIHNERVAPEDTVYFLGDAAMGNREQSLQHIGRMNGKKILIVGNHDKLFPDPWADTERMKYWRKMYWQYFQQFHTRLSLYAFRQDITLCHFPYYGDSGDKERYTKFRPKDKGRWLLHGHVHSPDFHHDERMIHVGVDSRAAQYGPIHLDQIGEVIQNVSSRRV